MRLYVKSLASSEKQWNILKQFFRIIPNVFEFLYALFSFFGSSAKNLIAAIGEQLVIAVGIEVGSSIYYAIIETYDDFFTFI